MLQKSLITAALLAVLVSSPIAAETTSGEAGPMDFKYDTHYHANQGSTLMRKWVVVNDPNLPAQILNYNGLRTDRPGRSWEHTASYSIAVTEPIVAFEVRIIPFDIWGERDTILTTTNITDLAVGQRPFDATWNTYFTAAFQHYASVAYVAQVKLQSGKVLKADIGPILEQARNFAEGFSAGDLEVDDEE